MKKRIFALTLAAMTLNAFAQKNFGSENLGQVVVINADSTTTLFLISMPSPQLTFTRFIF